MKDILTKAISHGLKELGVEGAKFSVEHPTNLAFGDYSTNAGIISKKAPDLLDWLNANKPEGVESIELKAGFINFFLSKKFFAESIKEILDKGENFGRSEHAKGFKVFVEHTQPNPFKAFHIGHLMNNAIGEAVARIIKWNGAEVKTATYHGDVGLHAAKAVWGILNGKENPYADGNRAYEEDEKAKQEIVEINKKIYDRSDADVNSAYDMGRAESLAEFEELYELLGSTFDYHFFESESGPIGKEIVLKNLGTIFVESDGATVFKGEERGLHTRVFLNSDKLPTYEAKEVGLVKIKKDAFPFGLSVTITANEQDAFFNVTEAAIGEVFPDMKGKLKHLSHGVLKLPTGKMSSRTGDVITAESLIESVKEKTKGNEAVAIAAIKYMILRSNIGSDIVFDFDKSVSTEGDSGVYLQYAHARACSVLEKAGKSGSADGERAETHEVERLLYRFAEIIERAGMEYAPSHIATYLTELAASFNNFYAHEQVISDDAESAYRLAIVEAFRNVMRNGLTVLDIPAPERI